MNLGANEEVREKMEITREVGGCSRRYWSWPE